MKMPLENFPKASKEYLGSEAGSLVSMGHRKLGSRVAMGGGAFGDSHNPDRMTATREMLRTTRRAVKASFKVPKF